MAAVDIVQRYVIEDCDQVIYCNVIWLSYAFVWSRGFRMVCFCRL